MAKKGLGKGLNALFDETDTVESSDNSVLELKITQIEPNKGQPRKNFDEEKLEKLAESIKEHGLVQPIVVTKLSNDIYQIVAGERRWRAAKLAGLTTIPAVVREYSKQSIAEIALIENLQREDLNPIEEAQGYKTLIDVYQMTQEKISERIGKSRSAIANSLRLLSLDEKIQKLIVSGEITSGHARAILSLPDTSLQHELAERIVSDGLNVRQAEAFSKQLQKKPKQKKEKTAFDIELDFIESRISKSLGTKVKISQGAKKGKIEIEYYSNEDLERLMGIFCMN